MKNRVFITGIAGFVGSNLANRLRDYKYYVNGCDNLKFGYADNLNSGISWEKHGLTEIGGEINGYDVLVHAATANIIYGMTDPIGTFRTNALESIDLIDKFKGKVVYTSTSSVYGNAKHFPTSEEHPVSVSNAYDQSKLILEKFLQIRGNYTTLRLSNVYGRNQRPENPYCGVVGKFIDAAFTNKPIKIYGQGKSTRDFTFIDDVVDAIILAIEADAQETEINIGTGKETSTIELATMIHDIIGTDGIFEYVPGRAIDTINRRCLDISKAGSLLGWSPITSLREGIEDTIFNQK